MQKHRLNLIYTKILKKVRIKLIKEVVKVHSSVLREFWDYREPKRYNINFDSIYWGSLQGESDECDHAK